MLEALKTNPILDEYKASKELHEEYCAKVKNLITDILKQKNVSCHSIDSRVKEENSLASKVENSGGKYHNLSDITDISGIRIITYFSEDVDRIASILQEEFQIDDVNSVDKRIKLDPDRFGYLSLHYVVGFNHNRLVLPEYQRFKDLKVEIQIRSILQHAWAEIEHDLGYKSKISIPNVVRRDFSRLAGLLELADEEFLRIRRTLEDYNESIKEEIKASPTKVLVDKITVTQLLEDNIAKILDQEICEIVGGKLTAPSDHMLENNVSRLKYLGLNTIDEVLNALTKYKDSIVRFAEEWIIHKENRNSVSAGICIFYLAYVMVGTTSSVEEINEYLTNFNIVSKDGSTSARIKRLCEKL